MALLKIENALLLPLNTCNRTPVCYKKYMPLPLAGQEHMLGCIYKDRVFLHILYEHG